MISQKIPFIILILMILSLVANLYKKHRPSRISHKLSILEAKSLLKKLHEKCGLKLFGFLFITLFIIFLNSTARATVTIVSFDERSFSSGEGRLLNNNNNMNTHVIYGGYSGTCKTFENDSVCNSCTGESLPCNRHRIHDNLVFSLSFQTTETGPILITTDSDDNQISLENVLGSVGDVSANSTVRIGIRWQQICQLLFDGASGCGHEEKLNPAARSIRIGVDSNRDGKFSSETSTEYTTEVRLAVLNMNDEIENSGSTIPLCFHDSNQESIISACNFSIYPGDEKVFVDDIHGSCRFPSVGNTQAQAIRVFYRDASKGILNDGTVDFVDLPIKKNDSICDKNTKVITTTRNQVDGLTNGQEYLFTIGIVDKAKNMGFVTEYSNFNNCFQNSDRDQCHSATPTEVVGLLEHRDCFITTATYGTFLHPKVKTFRRFRNRFLKTNRLGRLFIKAYYRYSPPLAKWITEHPGSRVLWKVLLWPLWFFAKICLEWFFPVLSASFLFIFLIKRKKKLLTRASDRVLLQRHGNTVVTGSADQKPLKAKS